MRVWYCCRWSSGSSIDVKGLEGLRLWCCGFEGGWFRGCVCCICCCSLGCSRWSCRWKGGREVWSIIIGENGVGGREFLSRSISPSLRSLEKDDRLRSLLWELWERRVGPSSSGLYDVITLLKPGFDFGYPG